MSLLLWPEMHAGTCPRLFTIVLSARLGLLAVSSQRSDSDMGGAHRHALANSSSTALILALLLLRHRNVACFLTSVVCKQCLPDSAWADATLPA